MQNVSRRGFLKTSVAVGAVSSLMPWPRVAGSNEAVNLGFISCGSRAQGLMGQFSKIDGVRIAALCDPDQQCMGQAHEKYPEASKFVDLRDLLEGPNVDAVVIATCNHWHCLAAIWAMQAGKDVYVEKPLSHSQWEGEQTVAAAHSLNRICQLGTQQRSDPMQAEIKRFLHDEKGLGEIRAVRVNRYGIRGPIGRREQPLQISKDVNYDLWLGPAADEPIFRDKLQYDWHWDWNTGSGEMGNWGVHVLDDVRNVVFQDTVALPRRILGGGGRVEWDDAGNTPNVHWAWFDTGATPVMIGLSNLPDQPNGRKAARHHGPDSGYVVFCEGGEYHGQRSRGVAYDRSGEKVREFSGNSGDMVHQQNFVDAVRAQDASMLNAPVETGNFSSGWCNLANIAVRAGREFTVDPKSSVDLPEWSAMIEDLRQHLAAYDLTMQDAAFRFGGPLSLDQTTGKFDGDGSDVANALLRREYRRGFEVPEFATTSSTKRFGD